ncbi:hypothetical protein V1517DRAFT_310093 [Lipomyces orientalis]|uniref:Uncharacterized protein n=1 Tax=Lipomyces orientalis TaxID=1233043 RepID=A0ACC3TG56_9ASCO
MDVSGKHHKTKDARRLIKHQRNGEKLSTHELTLIQKFRDKERIRQKNLRDKKRSCEFPKKRGRKPKAELQNIIAEERRDCASLHRKTDDSGQRNYQAERICQAIVASPVNISVNCWQGPCVDPVDLHGSLDHSSLPAIGGASACNPSTSDNWIWKSSSAYLALSTALSVSDAYSHAAAGRSLECISPSPMCSFSVTTLSSEPSPVSSVSSSFVETIPDEKYVRLPLRCSTPLALGYGRSESNYNSSRKHRRSTQLHPIRIGCESELSHGTCICAECISSLSKIQKRRLDKLHPHHLDELSACIQIWSNEDENLAFERLVACVSRVIEEVVAELRTNNLNSPQSASSEHDPYGRISFGVGDDMKLIF